MLKTKLLVTCLFFGLLFFSSAALANNYETVPLGTRTMSMGGAATAFGHDSAAPFLNPANMVLMHHDMLSLSANVYGFRNATAKNYFRLNPEIQEELAIIDTARKDMGSKSLDIFPSAMNYFYHFGPKSYPMVVSFSFFTAVHENQSFLGQPQILFADGGFRTTSRYVNEQNSYYFGPSYAVGLGEHFRLGLSVFMLHQPISMTKQASTLYTSANNTTFYADESTEFIDGYSFDMQFILGFGFTHSGFSVGLGASSPSLHLDGDFTNQYKLDTTAPGGADTYPSEKIIENLTGDLIINKPIKVNLGLGYEMKKTFSIALDVNLYMPMNEAMRYEGDIRSDTIMQYGIADSQRYYINKKFKHDMIINAKLGVEVIIADIHALRFGAFSDFSPVHIPGTADLDYTDLMTVKEDRFGGSLGYGFATDAFVADYGVAGYYGVGSIVGQQLFGDSYFKSDLTSYGFMFFLSASLDLEEIKRKIMGKVPGGQAAEMLMDPSSLLNFGEVKPLEITDISPRLAEYQHDPLVNTLIEQPMEYPQIGHEKYDAFFKRAAALEGGVAVARGVMARMREDIAQLSASMQLPSSEEILPMLVTMKASPDLEQFKDRIATIKQRAELFKDIMVQLASDASKLPADGGALIGAVKKDFQDGQAGQIMAVTNELSATFPKLTELLDQLQALMDDMAKTLSGLGQLGG